MVRCGAINLLLTTDFDVELNRTQKIGKPPKSLNPIK